MTIYKIIYPESDNTENTSYPKWQHRGHIIFKISVQKIYYTENDNTKDKLYYIQNDSTENTSYPKWKYEKHIIFKMKYKRYYIQNDNWENIYQKWRRHIIPKMTIEKIRRTQSDIREDTSYPKWQYRRYFIFKMVIQKIHQMAVEKILQIQNENIEDTTYPKWQYRKYIMTLKKHKRSTTTVNITFKYYKQNTEDVVFKTLQKNHQVWNKIMLVSIL